jgi:hypothetical protein
MPELDHSGNCHGSAYDSTTYGLLLADVRSSPISEFFFQRSPLGSKTLVGVANALKSSRIPKTRKTSYFINRKGAINPMKRTIARLCPLQTSRFFQRHLGSNSVESICKSPKSLRIVLFQKNAERLDSVPE